MESPVAETERSWEEELLLAQPTRSFMDVSDLMIPLQLGQEMEEGYGDDDDALLVKVQAVADAIRTEVGSEVESESDVSDASAATQEDDLVLPQPSLSLYADERLRGVPSRFYDHGLAFPVVDVVSSHCLDAQPPPDHRPSFYADVGQICTAPEPESELDYHHPALPSISSTLAHSVDVQATIVGWHADQHFHYTELRFLPHGTILPADQTPHFLYDFNSHHLRLL